MQQLGAKQAIVIFVAVILSDKLSYVTMPHRRAPCARQKRWDEFCHKQFQRVAIVSGVEEVHLQPTYSCALVRGDNCTGSSAPMRK